jgi:predicted CXXCH cytochrome family protein
LKYKKTIFVFSVISLFLIALSSFDSCIDKKEKQVNKELADNNNNYIGDAQCKSCHASEYDLWKSSDHFMAMLPANDSTVLGDFNDVILDADGIKSRFFKTGESFVVNTLGADGTNHDYEIKYIFGYYPLQQYLVEFPKGKMQVLRTSWDSKANKWFHQYTGQNIPVHDWLNWTNGAQTWNTMCADCHSTNLQKNYSYEADSFHTTWSSINVSCESCHGPAGRHIEYINSKDYDSGNPVRNSYFTFGTSDTSNVDQLNACARCHSRRSELGGKFTHSGEFMDNYLPEIIRNTHYHPDGQVNEEDYVYGSFVQSKMFHNYVKCTSCHDPHSMKLKFEGNMLCGQCHDAKYDSPAHHFHENNTVGSQCVSCHMPSKYYMGNDLRHDHSFRIPRPDQSEKYGTPNTCIGCHTDKSSGWASNAIQKWYGNTRAYHFSDDLIEGSLMNENSEVFLLNLLKKDSIPAIAQATAVYYLSQINNPQNIPLLLDHMQSNSPIVRVHALKSMLNIPGEYWFDRVLPLLDDPINSVRITAYEVLATIPFSDIPAQYQSSFNTAKYDYENYLTHQLDFPTGKAAMGLYKQRIGEYDSAVRYYESAIDQDSLQQGTRSNLSLVYNQLGENKKSEKVLLEELLINPENGSAAYNLALLYYELGEKGKALTYFEKSTKILADNPRIFYNYGLLLQETGNLEKAFDAFTSGLKINPNDNDLNYILALYFLNQKMAGKAKPYLETLVRNNPGDNRYRELLKSLSMMNQPVN